METIIQVYEMRLKYLKNIRDTKRSALTVREASWVLGITINSVYNAIRQGRLKKVDSKKPGRVLVDVDGVFNMML